MSAPREVGGGVAAVICGGEHAQEKGRGSHQATERLRLLGSELSGDAGRETPEVLVSKPKESSDLTTLPL